MDRLKVAAVIVVIGSIAAWAALSYWGGRAAAPPGDPYSQAEWYYFATEYEEAINHYREALKDEGLEESKARNAYFKVADCLEKIGRYPQAIQAYQEAIRKFPQSREANHAQGEIERIKLNHGIQ